MKDSKKWRARISVFGVAYHLGYFDDKQEAIEVRKRANRFTHYPS
jgi:hypothetical protein